MSVHKAIIVATKAIPPIGKDSENKEQRYRFRGIEAIKSIAGPKITEAGIFYAPRIIEQQHDTYTTGRGTVMQLARVTTEWLIFGPEGDMLDPCPITVGEGSDISDKASNKAQSAAEKYMLLQVFKIADGDQDDGDSETPEGRSSSSILRCCGELETDGHRPDCPAMANQATRTVTEAFPGAREEQPPPAAPASRGATKPSGSKGPAAKVWALCKAANLDPVIAAEEALGEKLGCRVLELDATRAGRVLDALKARGIS